MTSGSARRRRLDAQGGPDIPAESLPQHEWGPRWLRRRSKMMHRHEPRLATWEGDKVTLYASVRAPKRVSGGRVK